MAGIAAPSLPTLGISYLAVTARDAEFTGTPLTDIDGTGTYGDPYLGCNRAGSNACGIGVATGIVAADDVTGLSPEKWTLLDQNGNGRTAQNTQHIGGIVDTAPAYAGVPFPTPAQASNFPVRFAAGNDYNDTANFVVADTAAVDGAVADTVTGALNETGATIAIGNVLWGRVPV